MHLFREQKRIVASMLLGLTLACTAESLPPAQSPNAELSTESEPETPVNGCNGHWVTTVRGQVRDEAHNSLDGAKAQLCVREAATDKLVCLQPETTEADGTFVIPVPESSYCMARAALRVVLPQTNYAATYCTLDLRSKDGEVALATPFTLYAVNAAVALPPRGDANAVRSVSFENGLEVEIVPSRYKGIGAKAYENLGARWLPNADLCGAPALLGTYAFAPEGDVEGENFTVRLPNATALPKNTEVDIFVLGGLHCTLPNDEAIAEGQWRKIGQGQVTGDWIETQAGLPCLTWMGYAVHRT